MKLIVGLGNPGKQYEGTRHNMGFMVLDEFAEMLSVDIDRDGFKGQYVIVKDPRFPEPFMLLKPTTFMNLSGESVREAFDYYKIDLDDVVVIYDDMALPEGKIRLRGAGSSGSHNGMKNIILHMGSEDFVRVRVGVGDSGGDMVGHVLGHFSSEDAKKMSDA